MLWRTKEPEMPHRKAEDQARACFPRGLLQPAGSYRFAVDSLLLAAFITPKGRASLLDIGTGCGVVALASLCLFPGLHACGIEREPELAAAARSNAETLGFAECFRVLQADIAVPGIFAGERAGDADAVVAERAFDIVLANPPFRQRDKGRTPASPLRLKALFEEQDTLAAFCRCAARALAPEGRFGILYDVARKDFLFATLAESGLAPVRMLPVRALPGKAPFRILVEACLCIPGGESPPVQIEKALVISGENGQPNAEARAFCPLLV